MVRSTVGLQTFRRPPFAEDGPTISSLLASTPSRCASDFGKQGACCPISGYGEIVVNGKCQAVLPISYNVKDGASRTRKTFTSPLTRSMLATDGFPASFNPCQPLRRLA